MLDSAGWLVHPSRALSCAVEAGGLKWAFPRVAGSSGSGQELGPLYERSEVGNPPRPPVLTVSCCLVMSWRCEAFLRHRPWVHSLNV